MIHYTCDACKRELCDDEARYVVRLEVYAARDPLEADQVDSDRDHLEEIGEILQRMDEIDDSDLIGDDVYQHRRYDLCSECRKKFLLNPLKTEFLGELHFSQN
jgi:hypothetical protein